MSTLPESPFEKHIDDPVMKDMLRIAQGASDILATFFQKTDLRIEEKTTKENIVTEADFAADAYITQQIQKQYPQDAIFSEESGKNERIKTAEWIWVIDPLDGTHNFSQHSPNFATMICRAKNPFRDGFVSTGDESVDWAVIQSPTLALTAWAQKERGAFLNDQRIELPDNQSLDTVKAVSGGAITAKYFYPEKDELPGEVLSLQFQKMMQERGIRVDDYWSAAVSLLSLLEEKTTLRGFNDLFAWDFAPLQLIATEAGLTVSHFFGEPIAWHAPEGGYLIAPPTLHAEIRELLQAHV